MSDNGIEESEEPLDPRIRVALEQLNKCSSDINGCEVVLDVVTSTVMKTDRRLRVALVQTVNSRARSQFRCLLNETTQQLEALASKLGSCVEKARPYYEARKSAKEAQALTQEAAHRFELSCSQLEAAKEMVNLAEQGYFKKGQPFDPAWQEMLNHSTVKVNEAEKLRLELEIEHKLTAEASQEAESLVKKLQHQCKRNITKSMAYFELKAQINQKMEVQKNKVAELENRLKEAKGLYGEALRTLEKISEEIHESRRSGGVSSGSRTENKFYHPLMKSSDSLPDADIIVSPTTHKAPIRNSQGWFSDSFSPPTPSNAKHPSLTASDPLCSAIPSNIPLNNPSNAPSTTTSNAPSNNPSNNPSKSSSSDQPIFSAILLAARNNGQVGKKPSAASEKLPERICSTGFDTDDSTLKKAISTETGIKARNADNVKSGSDKRNAVILRNKDSMDGLACSAADALSVSTNLISVASDITVVASNSSAVIGLANDTTAASNSGHNIASPSTTNSASILSGVSGNTAGNSTSVNPSISGNINTNSASEISGKTAGNSTTGLPIITGNSTGRVLPQFSDTSVQDLTLRSDAAARIRAANAEVLAMVSRTAKPSRPSFLHPGRSRTGSREDVLSDSGSAVAGVSGFSSEADTGSFLSASVLDNEQIESLLTESGVSGGSSEADTGSFLSASVLDDEQIESLLTEPGEYQRFLDALDASQTAQFRRLSLPAKLGYLKDYVNFDPRMTDDGEDDVGSVSTHDDDDDYRSVDYYEKVGCHGFERVSIESSPLVRQQQQQRPDSDESFDNDEVVVVRKGINRNGAGKSGAGKQGIPCGMKPLESSVDDTSQGCLDITDPLNVKVVLYGKLDEK